MRGRVDIAGQLPPPGIRRWVVLASLALGGLVAAGLTVLIVVFLVSSLGR